MEWIAEAIEAILYETETRGVRSLALPFLGACHGKLDPERFVTLLRDALDEMPPATLQRLWLIVPEDIDLGVFAPFERPPTG